MRAPVEAHEPARPPANGELATEVVTTPEGRRIAIVRRENLEG